MQDCTKRNVSTETKFRFHVFQDERFVDLNLYQYGWEQTEPLHSYGSYTKNPNPSPIEKRFGFSILTAVLPLDIPTGWEPRTNKSPTGAFVAAQTLIFRRKQIIRTHLLSETSSDYFCLVRVARIELTAS